MLDIQKLEDLKIEAESRLRAAVDAANHGLVDEDTVDSELCNYTYRSMMYRLEVARRDGRNGWYSQGIIDEETLKTTCTEHLRKLQYDKAMDFASMLAANQFLNPESE